MLNNYDCKSPQFTGYVLPSTRKAIVKTTDNICKGYLNNDRMPVDINAAVTCKDLGAQILKTLDNAMKKFNNDTVLDLTGVSYDQFILRNNKTNTSLGFKNRFQVEPSLCAAWNERIIGKVKNDALLLNGKNTLPTNIFNTVIDGKRILCGLLEFAENLNQKAQSKDVDKQLFKQYLIKLQSGAMGNCLSRFKALRKAEDAQNMAAEFGVKPDGIAYGIKRKAAEAKLNLKNRHLS